MSIVPLFLRYCVFIHFKVYVGLKFGWLDGNLFYLATIFNSTFKKNNDEPWKVPNTWLSGKLWGENTGMDLFFLIEAQITVEIKMLDRKVNFTSNIFILLYVVD